MDMKGVSTILKEYSSLQKTLESKKKKKIKVCPLSIIKVARQPQQY